jgi:hypothetical protein
MHSNQVYLSNGIKFMQQNLVELSLTDTIPESDKKCLIYRESQSEKVLMKGYKPVEYDPFWFLFS